MHVGIEANRNLGGTYRSAPSSNPGPIEFLICLLCVEAEKGRAVALLPHLLCLWGLHPLGQLDKHS
jgi:hypothetical protein